MKKSKILSAKNIQQMPMGQALTELNREMAERDMPPVTLNVVGGFALMTRNLRPAETLTDIDYVGDPLSKDFTRLADQIGRKYSLPSQWINNDVMLSGIDMQDFEFATGELHFDPALSLSHIEVNVLQPQDLLRMKMISLDTAAMAAESGGDFTRMKDFDDVLVLMKDQHITSDELYTKFEDYISPSTAKLIQRYESEGTDGVDRWLHETQQQYQEDFFMSKALSDDNYQLSGAVRNMLAQLYERAEHTDFDVSDPYLP